MRYTQSRSESAELLRMVLREPSQHDAPFDPVAYTVWYEHLGRINQSLSRALEAKLAAGARLDGPALFSLYLQHVAAPGVQDAERIGTEMERVARNVIDASVRTGHAVRSYGEDLLDLEQMLGQAPGPEALKSGVGHTLLKTRDMQGTVESLTAELARNEQEIQRLREEVARVRTETTIDPLTHVLNRRGFDEALQAAFHRRPSAGFAHCVVMLDIDHFKRINDEHGHLTGDEVLRLLASELLRASAHQDGAVCARYGGEEFVVLLKDTTLAQAQHFAEALRHRFKSLKFVDRSSGEVLTMVTFSAGVAAWDGVEAASSLLASADGALYRSKSSGRDRCTVA